MKASELIGLLVVAISQDGDQEVRMSLDPDGPVPHANTQHVVDVDGGSGIVWLRNWAPK